MSKVDWSENSDQTWRKKIKIKIKENKRKKKEKTRILLNLHLTVVKRSPTRSP